MTTTNSKQRKFLVITGGVISGLGKGVTTSSIGLFFSDQYKVTPMKFDGYLNTDPGTMNPFEHGEVFVLDDGAETDMDFGHYERFLANSASKQQSITMGKIYQEIRRRERHGDYLGKTVQLIPHVTDLIQEKIIQISEEQDADLMLIEVGGTVGDLENDLFIEALRQLRAKVGSENVCYLHLTYVPIPYGVNEQKTKPTQQSINLLQTKGIWPDFIIARCTETLTENSRKKIALFAGLTEEDVYSGEDVTNIYTVPKGYEEQGLIDNISTKLGLGPLKKERYKHWQELLSKERKGNVKIAICGKYTDLEDSYASVVEALHHCSFHFGTNIEIVWLETSHSIDKEILKTLDAIIVPGGFGNRGIEGKIEVITYARENKIPYLGICYGLQLAVVEFARKVCNIKDANSLEIDPKTTNPLITMLDEQKKVVNLGGSMRLGAYEAKIKKSNIQELYKKLKICKEEKDECIVSERHRHRYEVNPDYIKTIEDKGLKVVGYSRERELVEFIELENHPYFVATQAHPELKSKLETPAPLFYGLVEAALTHSKKEK